MEEEGGQLIVQLDDFFSRGASDEKVQKLAVVDVFCRIREQFLELKVVLWNFRALFFRVIGVDFPLVLEYVDIIQVERQKDEMAVLVDDHEQVFGARDECLADLDGFLWWRNLNSVDGFPLKCVYNKEIISKTRKCNVRPINAEGTNRRIEIWAIFRDNRFL